MVPDPPLPPIDSEAALVLTRRLVSIPSVSPDVGAETRCAETLAAHLPAESVHGMWSLPDGRPVVWALLQGRSPRTVVMLGHFDTVGVPEFTSLGAPGGQSIAFHPRELREWLLASRREGRPMPPDVISDLDRELAAPGTWMFGRGALDMKSGLAAGAAAFESLARTRLDGNVLYVATPDEEFESAGMTTAAAELVRLRDARGLDYVGAINLDYAGKPCGYHGLAGKLALGCLVLGAPTHAGAPWDGTDAAQLAAAIAVEATTSPALLETVAGTERLAPPTVLQLRDLKPGYDVQTAAEAFVEFNVIRADASLDAIFDAFRRVVERAHAGIREGMDALWLRGQGVLSPGATPARIAPALAVHVLPDLMAAAVESAAPEARPVSSAPAIAAGLLPARRYALEFVRRIAREAALRRPAVVVFLLPPFYPSAAPRDSAVGRALATVLADEGLPVRGRYPFISDASYVAWRAETTQQLMRQLPGWGSRYRPPLEAAGALDLDVVTLGPWGRGAHGLYERVHAPYAFETLPRLLVRTVLEAVRA